MYDIPYLSVGGQVQRLLDVHTVQELRNLGSAEISERLRRRLGRNLPPLSIEHAHQTVLGEINRLFTATGLASAGYRLET